MAATVMAVLLLAVATAAAEGDKCNRLESSSNGSQCLCSDSALLYDYSSSSCTDAATLFQSDFCGGHYEREDPQDKCDCSLGFTASNDVCVDIDECNGTDLCSDPLSGQACVNDDGTFVTAGNGSYYCACDQLHYRPPGATVDQCGVPQLYGNRAWNNCPQYAQGAVEDPGFECICFDDSMFDAACQLNADYEDCTEDLQNVTCVLETATETRQYFPHQGYQWLEESHTAVDVDECSDSEPTCWRDSTCRNLEGGGYDCECNPGYTDHLFPDTMKECLPLQCLGGSGEQCLDVCSGKTCEVGSRCSPVGCGGWQCSPSLESTPLTEGAFLLTGTLTTDLAVRLCLIVQSLEAVYGEGTVQATAESDTQFRVVVKAEESLVDRSEDTEPQERLGQYCQPLEMEPGLCVLPLGIPVHNSSLSLTRPADLCTESPVAPCPASHRCSSAAPGAYQCLCTATGSGDYIAGVQVCTVDESVQQRLEDVEQDKTVIAAVLGSLLGLFVVATAVLAFFIYRLKTN